MTTTIREAKDQTFMIVPFVDLVSQHAEVNVAVRNAIDHVLESCVYSGGPVIEEFERNYARYCQTDFCVTVSSGTAALELLLRAYGVGAGDEVILPVNTFVATAEAISLVGARPVFVDVDIETANLDPELLEQAITPKTKGIIPVHLYGQPANMEPIMDLARARKLFVIEDSCQAHGALLNERRAGSLADAAAFSFYPSKNLGAYGEGGCITTNNADIAEHVRKLRDHGSIRKYCHDMTGSNDRMDAIQAAVLNVKHAYLDQWNQQRRIIAKRYRSALNMDPRIRLFSEVEGCQSVYHLFVVGVSDRDRVRQELGDQRIMTGIHYPIPLHLQPAYKDLGYRKGDFPVAEQLSDEILSLPMYPHLGLEHVAYVAEELMNRV